MSCLPKIKDPDAKLDYGVDWTSWLDGDIIDSSSWDIPTGLTLVSETDTDTHAIVWLSGGAVGEMYPAVNHIITALGREDDRTLNVKIENTVFSSSRGYNSF